MIDRNLKNLIPERVYRTLEDMDRKMTVMTNELAALKSSVDKGQLQTAQQFSNVAGLIGARSQAIFGQDVTDPSLPGQIGGGTVTTASGGTTGFSFTGSGTATITLTLAVTAGAIIFGNAAGNGIATDAANFFWDDTNNFFGLGTNVPNVPFHLVANFADWTQRIVNSNASGNGLVIVAGNGGVATGIIQQWRDKDGNVRATLLAKGWMGIGTATPGSPLAVVGLPVYATNALAVAGGLAAGDFYRLGGDPDQVCVVH